MGASCCTHRNEIPTPLKKMNTIEALKKRKSSIKYDLSSVRLVSRKDNSNNMLNLLENVADNCTINKYSNKRFNSMYLNCEDLEECEFYKLKLIHDKFDEKLVKVYNKQQVSERVSKCIKTEVKLYAKLDHPNIIRIHEIFDEETKVYVTMDVLRGKTLYDLMNSKILHKERFTEKEITAIIYQLLSVTAYMHSQQIIHRDIKPENVGFTKKKLNSLKITSFLTCIQQTSPGSTVQGLCGSYTYMAPEVILGSAYNEKCDLWSIGIIMYILMCGEHPLAKIVGLEKSKQKIYMMQKFRGIDSVESVIDFERKEFEVYNKEATKLLKRMLSLEDTRVNATSLLRNRWLEQSYQSYRPSSISRDSNVVSKFKAVANIFNSSSFKRAILAYLAPRLVTQAQVGEFEDLFKLIDRNGDGYITKDELENVLTEKYVHKIGQTAIKKFSKMLSFNEKDTITFQEFVTSSIVFELLKEKDEDKLLRKMFDALDTNSKGTIAMDEILTIFKDNKLPELLVDMLSLEIDEDNVHNVDFEEFKLFMK